MAGSHVQKPKRQQVSKACLTCRRAKAKCGPGRPCPRCVRMGVKDPCIDFDDRPSTLAAHGEVAVIERPFQYKVLRDACFPDVLVSASDLVTLG